MWGIHYNKTTEDFNAAGRLNMERLELTIMMCMENSQGPAVRVLTLSSVLDKKEKGNCPFEQLPSKNWSPAPKRFSVGVSSFDSHALGRRQLCGDLKLQTIALLSADTNNH